MGCPLEAFFLGLISTQLLWKGVISAKAEGYDLKAPDHVLVEEGLCAMIPCNFTYNQNHAKKNAVLYGFWKKGTDNNVNNKEVASSHGKVDDKHFQLIGNLIVGNCSLLILNPQKDDIGKYFFRMEKEKKARFSFFSYANPYLNVTERQPPEIKMLDTMRAGNSTNITCTTFASCSRMPPKITWNGLPEHVNFHLQMNESLQVYSSVVVFSPSAEDHERNVSCRVNYTNRDNSVPRETIRQLNVTFPPQILVIKGEHFCSNKSQEIFTNTSQLMVQKGDCIQLRCNVKGNPSPNVTWIKETKVLETSPLNDVLKLSDLKPEDAGKYTCQANNEVGSEEKSFELVFTDQNKTLLLTVTTAFILLAIIVLIAGIILVSKRYWRKNKRVTGSERGNTLSSLKQKPKTLDPAAQEANGVPPRPRSRHESVNRDPTDPEEIHYATLTFNATHPKTDMIAEEVQTDYAEIRPFKFQEGKEAQRF